MSQSYANHRRTRVDFHYVVTPILLIEWVHRIVVAVREPGLASAWGVLVMFAITLGVGLGRVHALTVQDRVIRLEETLRLQRLLPEAEHASITRLRRGQFVALRFAPDAELPELFRRTLAGEFAKPDDIKKAVREWRADHFRA